MTRSDKRTEPAMVGTSSADLPLRAEVEVRGDLRELPARSHFFSTVEVG